MSTYPPLPPSPSPQWEAPPRPEPPQAIRTALTIVSALIALSVFSTILVYLYLDELVAAAAGPELPSAQQDIVRTFVIVGGVIGFLVFGALWVALAIYLRKGANWARIVLTVLAALGILSGVFGLATRGQQPAIFVVLTVVQLGLYAALLFFLWRRESTAYLTTRWQA